MMYILMNAAFDELITSFVYNEVGISEYFLTHELASLLQKNLLSLNSAELMQPAGIGNGSVKDIHQKHRGDKIYWLDKKNNDIHELAFLALIERFITYLNETCYTGINAYEFHYAIYEAGTYYHRHKDQFKNNQDRKYSLICYLNDDWTLPDGGELLIHHQDKTDTILPTIQKAIFFRSNELEHEVAIAHRPRMSITGWLKCS